MKKRCPDCGSLPVAVIYMGFPMRLCTYHECARLSGFWSFLVGAVFPFNGYFYVYEESYLKGLWHWLFDLEEKA